MKTLKNSILISILILGTLVAKGQKKVVDTFAFYHWPRIDNPLMSPNGRYICYTQRNTPIGKSSIFFENHSHKWQRKLQCSNDYFEVSVNNKQAVFGNGNDSLCIVNLGGGYKYYPGYKNFKIADNSESTLAMGGNNKLLLIRDGKEIPYSNILNYYFVQNGKSLIVQTRDTLEGRAFENLLSIDVKSLKQTLLWKGEEIQSLIISNQKDKVAFISINKANEELSQTFIINLSSGNSFSVNNDFANKYLLENLTSFNKDGQCLILSLKDRTSSQYTVNSLQLKVWSYKDEKIQSQQIEDIRSKHYKASISLLTKRMFVLERPNDIWNPLRPPNEWGEYCLVSQTIGDCDSREWWNPACKKNWFLINIRTGNRKRLNQFDGTDNSNILSPNDKFILSYDYDTGSYRSYSISSDSLYELTNDISKSLFSKPRIDTGIYLNFGQRGIGGWSKDGKEAYIYDAFDIWRLDLRGEMPPINMTNSYGRNNNIVLSFIQDKTEVTLSNKDKPVLVGLNIITKENGFYKASCDFAQNPTLLSSGQYIYYLPFHSVDSYRGLKPVKASSSNNYIVGRESADSFPNIYRTSDFEHFIPITNLHPEKSYNWVKTELHEWKLPDGKDVQGVLYKPENFDPTKKYPIIFNIYSRVSNTLNAYEEPAPICSGCTINTTFLVSNGYLVFKPDIYFKFDKAGESALKTVESAIAYLKKFPWIDTSKMGLQGCSFGGFQTNYIVTHSKLFAAACSASGVSELSSYYSAKFKNTYTSFNYGQYVPSKNIWENPQSLIDNSPMYKVENISTPLLLFLTTVDDAVPSPQGMQFYLVMRRLGKPAWLLEYGRGNHGVFYENDSKDFGLRMFQFFNYYLKNASPPIWMTQGVPAKLNNINNGLQLDTTGAKP